ncbi:MAG: endolytic transglycosylase MltG [Candidatus Paceibacterota bacterium]|jgi:UPF0755 protein
MENLPKEFKNPNEGQSFVSTKDCPSWKNNKKYFYYLVGSAISLGFVYFLFISTPRDFPVGAILRVEKGSNLRNISAELKNEHLIRSRVIFESFVIIFGAELHIVSANYLFEKKLPVWEIAWRIASGEHRMAPVSITIPEGYDIGQIGDTVSLKLINFNNAQFLIQAKKYEGYLFPDTYFFLADADEKVVLKSMTENFEKKINPLRKEIISLNKNEKDIIIMASIIERESKGDIDRGVISGILWRRIKIGMPLQVDAAPETYQTRGLPKSPISNPGILAIKASIYPESSPYLYYLHDKDGGIHYAKTFAEHVQNKFKYLK